MIIYLVDTKDESIEPINIEDVPNLAGITSEQFAEIYGNDPTRINGNLNCHFFFYTYEDAKEQFKYCK